MLKKNKILPNNQTPSILLPTKSPNPQQSPLIRSPIPDSKNDEAKKYVEIFVQCKDIMAADDFSKTDPFVALHVKRYCQWWEYGRTETIANCHAPSFVETFCIDAQNRDNERIKLSLYDSDNMSSKDLQKCKLLGSVEVEVKELQSDCFNEITLKHDRSKSAGILCLCAVPVDGGLQLKRQVRLNVGAVRIARKNIFNRADVFLELSREVFPGTYHPVYRSEIIFKTNTPHWKMFTINAQKLCNGDVQKDILIQIWHYNTKSEKELKGSVTTNMARLLKFTGVVKEIPLRKISTSRFRKKDKERKFNVGYLKLYHVSMDEQYSLVDYLTSGVVFQCSIGIDFTLSNGNCLTESTSLHYLQKDGSNDYVTALQQIGSWMSHYCQKIPLVGFGGKLHSKPFQSASRKSVVLIESKLNNLLKELKELDNNNDTETNKDENYCFEINNNNLNIDTVIASYIDIIPMVEPSGPTYFGKTIQRLLPKTLETEDNFSLVLLVTDGVCNDETELEEFLLTLSDKPVIVIIAGVGPCSFTPTLHLVNRVNRKAQRKILFFYTLRDTQPEQKNVKELYVKVSKSIVEYFLKKNIHPKKVYDVGYSMLDVDMQEAVTSRSSSPTSDIKTCCPTCGSQVNLSAMS